MTDREQIVFLNSSLEIELSIDRSKLTQILNWLMFWLIHRFLSHIREQYHKQGAPYELSFEQKQELGLIEPSSWNLEKLSDIQNKIAEPLVLYWFVFFIAFFSKIIYQFIKSSIIYKTKNEKQ